MNKEVDEIRRMLEAAIPTFWDLLWASIAWPSVWRNNFKLPFGHRGGNQPVKENSRH